MTRGGRNIIIMGTLAVAIAIASTSVALVVYHNSGDIYLDRSRPGFLPDENEQGQEEETDGYEFDENSSVTKESLDEYLESFDKQIKAVDSYSSPFDAEQLSDEKLGI
ncbi:hypothetical protein IJ117_00890 [Candidatus Saccharibacteria bacterium]|nr:hypothetical protein [Candidatus Saccharibacteria bacterium]